jgi:hypothetical protein
MTDAEKKPKKEANEKPKVDAKSKVGIFFEEKKLTRSRRWMQNPRSASSSKKSARVP